MLIPTPFGLYGLSRGISGGDGGGYRLDGRGDGGEDLLLCGEGGGEEPSGDAFLSEGEGCRGEAFLTYVIDHPLPVFLIHCIAVPFIQRSSFDWEGFSHSFWSVEHNV